MVPTNSVIFLLNFLVSSIDKVRGNPSVIFRVDDVQAWWCEEIAKEVINTFLAQSTPVNLGIIGENLDQSASLSSYLASIAANPLLEMTTHSNTHISYMGKTVTWQRDDLRASIDMIISVTGVTPVSFITPYNEYDASTAVSLIAESMSIMSASCVWDRVSYEPLYCLDGSNVVAPNIEWNGVFSLPAGAVLGGDDYWEDYNLPASVSDAVGWIEAQIGAYLGHSILS